MSGGAGWIAFERSTEDRLLAAVVDQMGLGRKVWAIVHKDLVMETRSPETLGSMVIFTFVIILIFGLAFELRVEEVTQVAPGMLWVAFAFAGTLGLSRSFGLERDQGCLDGLLLCPTDRSVIFLGKMLSSLLFVSGIEAIALPIFLVLFNLPFEPLLLGITLAGTVGHVGVGTLLSAMTVRARSRELLLPLLLFPVLIPVLVASVRLMAGVFDSEPWSSMGLWLRLLVVYDIVVLTTSCLTFDHAMQE